LKGVKGTSNNNVVSLDRSPARRDAGFWLIVCRE
jgi:hypothetical protein